MTVRSPSTAPAGDRATPGARAIGAAAGLMVLLYTLLLWPEWGANPDLSHGFFAPVVFVLLLWESRRAGPQRWWRAGAGRTALVIAVLVGTVALFGISGLLAASVGWSHAVVKFVLAGTLAGFLLASLLVLSGEEVRVIPLNWISVTAILLWVLVAPLPPGTYTRLTLSLQTWVTDGVLQSLHVLGVPARQRGNVIELALTSVGVEDACSGIRSLLSCVYAGCFFAAWQVRHLAGRLALIVAAPVLAIAMNFLRSLTLTLLANDGVDISGFWHDATGFAILGLTAAALAAGAVLLSPKSETVAAVVAPGQPARRVNIAYWSGLGALAALLLFFWIHARPAPASDSPGPDLPTLLPEVAEGWEVRTTPDLYRFSSVLKTDTLFERTYLKHSDGRLVQFTAYVAYWRAGQVPVSLVATHTPDACWPGTGWIKVPSNEPQTVLAVGGRRLTVAEQRVFRDGAGFEQHVWFWHLYDGRPVDYRAPYSVSALIQIALDYGFRRDGDQLFIRLSSNQPWNALSHEPLVRELIANLSRTGL